ncbi:unnamed protein product [Nesidiocoris tenuis]|uniref:Uncharacterized protein n=1 Tax=Nesidiocoris tenuis TaxID=355587 RepID=A0A6H5H3U1_9HEMI|nr:unnamed protein product [Nesidiocoris tenuis]
MISRKSEITRAEQIKQFQRQLKRPHMFSDYLGTSTERVLEGHANSMSNDPHTPTAVVSFHLRVFPPPWSFDVGEKQQKQKTKVEKMRALFSLTTMKGDTVDTRRDCREQTVRDSCSRGVTQAAHQTQVVAVKVPTGSGWSSYDVT